MSYRVLVYLSSLEELLNKLGYTLGYSTVAVSSLDLGQTDYYFRNNSVIRITGSSVFVESIRFCSASASIKMYDISIEEFKTELSEHLKEEGSLVPSILSTFTDILFHSFDSPDAKLARLRDASKNFHPDFLRIFQSELNAMSQTTQVQAQFNLYDVLTDGNREYMIVGKADQSIVVREVGIEYRMEDRAVSLGEISNGSKWKLIADTEVLRRQEQMFKQVCTYMSFLLDGSVLSQWIGGPCPSLPKEMLGTHPDSYELSNDFLLINIACGSDAYVSISNDSCNITYGAMNATQSINYDKLVIRINEEICKYAMDAGRKRVLLIQSVAAFGYMLVKSFELYLYKTDQLKSVVDFANETYSLCR